MNIAGLLTDGIARAGDRLALVQGSRALTYQALGDRVTRLAAGLAGLGLRRGDRIVLLMPNRPELVESLGRLLRRVRRRAGQLALPSRRG